VVTPQPADVVPDHKDDASVPSDALTRSPERPRTRPQWLLWVWWVGCLVVVGAGMLLLRARLDKAHVALVFLLVVLGGSAAAGRALGLTLAFAAFLSFNFFFLRPYSTLVIADPFDWLVLLTFLITSIVAAQLLYRARSTAEAAMQRAAEVDRLAALGAETLGLPRPEDALRAILDVIRTTLGVASCDVFVRAPDGSFIPAASSPTALPAVNGSSLDDAVTTERRGLVASAPVNRGQPASDTGSLLAWIFAHGHHAVELIDGTVRVVSRPGRAVAPPYSSAGVRAMSIPLAVRGHTVGVLRVEAQEELALTPEQARFLDALAYYAALGVERARLVADAERAESERRLEALRSALLTAVSHDLRTPLTTIKAIAHEIADGGERDRARVIEDESDRLDALVGDLLDFSRIQAGAVHPTLEVNTIDDLVGAALRRADALLRDRRVEIDLPAEELLSGRFDLSNSLRALVNLLENACKYSPPDTPITIRARREGEKLRISVIDRGPGIPPSERQRVFEPFYRPRNTAPDIRGTGLGLSIARGLAFAQGGTVEYRSPPEGGASFSLILPAADGPAPDGDDTAAVDSSSLRAS
jgi:two-component system, OmpR family, sensor histidine kinase KdpD